MLVLAGGTCALLLQLAHPAVAAGVAQHSSFRDDPFARLRRTLHATFEVVFGTGDRARRSLARIDAIHRGVRGSVPETGIAYEARDPRLLLWVHATLVDTALRVYDRFVTRLTSDEEQAYHVESTQVAVALGVPPALVPPTLDELRALMADMIESGEICVTPTARELSRAVLYPTRIPPRPVWDAAHLISLSVMPAAVRSGYGIGWSAARARGIERLAAASRIVYPRLPSVLRHVPQSRAAERRLRASSGARTGGCRAR